MFRDIPFKVCKRAKDCTGVRGVGHGGSFTLEDQTGGIREDKGWISNSKLLRLTFSPHSAGNFQGSATLSRGSCAIRITSTAGGLGYAHSTDMPGLSFYPNKRAGLSLHFTEVDCDGGVLGLVNAVDLRRQHSLLLYGQFLDFFLYCFGFFFCVCFQSNCSVAMPYARYCIILVLASLHLCSTHAQTISSALQTPSLPNRNAVHLARSCRRHGSRAPQESAKHFVVKFGIVNQFYRVVYEFHIEFRSQIDTCHHLDGSRVHYITDDLNECI